MEEGSKPVRGKAQPNFELLKLLQENPELSGEELAPRAGLTPSALYRQVERLREEGIIERRLRVNHESLGLEMAIIGVKMRDSGQYDEFESWVKGQAHIVGVWAVEGEFDYIIFYVAPTSKAIHDFTNRLSRNPTVPPLRNQETFRVSAVVKDTPKMPLDHLLRNSS